MPHVVDVDLGSGVAGWFTGRASGPDPAVGKAGNLSARRPHQPARLAADRLAAFGRHGVAAEDVHLMHQVHGTRVVTVAADDPPGRVPVRTDAVVTTLAGRALAVLTADCLPVLMAGPTTVAAVHAGRRGLHEGILARAVAACERAGDAASSLRAVIGPAIHACCYEVPRDLQAAVTNHHPAAHATTQWGTPGLDLPGAAVEALADLGVSVYVVDACTRCDQDRWFSHRGDPDAGRQAGVVVRPAEVAA